MEVTRSTETSIPIDLQTVSHLKLVPSAPLLGAHTLCCRTLLPACKSVALYV